MSARDRIFAKLHAAQAQPLAEPQTREYYAQMSPHWDSPVARLRHWAATMRQVKGEIVWCHAHDWAEHLVAVANQKNLNNIVLPMTTAHGAKAAQALQQRPETHVTAYERQLDDWKQELFANVDAGFTDVKAGIAHTGTLVLWSTPEQPRTMSLVPPIHIALFDTTTLYDDFYQAMHGLEMANHMPTNVVLVSGPSKTSDIQLTLAYGAHGPRDLVVLAVLPDNIAIADVEERL